MYVSAFLCVHQVQTGFHRGQKRGLAPLKVELQAVVSYLMWMLGTERASLQEQQVLLSSEISL